MFFLVRRIEPIVGFFPDFDHLVLCFDLSIQRDTMPFDARSVFVAKVYPVCCLVRRCIAFRILDLRAGATAK